MFSKIKDKLYMAYVVFGQSIKSFDRNNNSSMAASLAYYSLFALIPLLLLLFFTLSLFIASSTTIMHRITELIVRVIPYYSDTILREVYALARHQGVWGLISIGALLWALMPLMSTLRTSFFDIFKVQERPHFLKSVLVDISVVLLSLTLLVCVTLFSVTLKKLLILQENTILYDIAFYGLTILIMCIFYLVFVPAKVPFCYIFIGSVLTTFLWGIIRPVFGLFLSYNPQYGITFGSLKALFIIIIWIYYSYYVLLFCAEIIANLRRKDVLMLRGLFYDTANHKTSLKLKKRFGKSYDAGDVIFNEGDAGNELFYVLSGSVRLIKNEQTFRVMGKGEYFGEMALLIETPRTTGAQAEEDETVLIVITPENFETLLREEPKIALQFLKELANRLKKTNEDLF